VDHTLCDSEKDLPILFVTVGCRFLLKLYHVYRALLDKSHSVDPYWVLFPSSDAEFKESVRSIPTNNDIGIDLFEYQI